MDKKKSKVSFSARVHACKLLYINRPVISVAASPTETSLS